MPLFAKEPTNTTTATRSAAAITDERQYCEQGNFILERAIPYDQLEMLRGECQHFVDAINAEMDDEGVRVKGINHIGGRGRYDAVHRHHLHRLAAVRLVDLVSPLGMKFVEMAQLDPRVRRSMIRFIDRLRRSVANALFYIA